MTQRIGLGTLGDQPLDSLVGQAALAEERGLHSIWVAEDYYLRDAFTSMGVLAARTKKIKIATGVINPYTRHPALTAMSLATVNEFAPDRIFLGIGSSVKMWIEDQMGMPLGNRLVVIREYIQLVRSLLKGEKVTFDGSYFKLKDVALGGMRPAPNLPIYLAAVGPKMLHLAGEIADGVLLTAGNSPVYVRYALDQLRDGAQKAGRDKSKIDIASYVYLSVDANGKKAMDAARGPIAYVLSPTEYGDLMCRVSGFDPKILVGIRKALESGAFSDASNLVTDEMVDAFSASGTRKNVRANSESIVTQALACP